MSTAVRSRVFKISAAAVTAAIAIGLCLFSQDDVSASIKERRVERLNAQIENVYTDEYQQMMTPRSPTSATPKNAQSTASTPR